MVALGLMASACGDKSDMAALRERMNERVVRAQVALGEAVEGPKQEQEVELELREREAIAQAEAAAELGEEQESPVEPQNSGVAPGQARAPGPGAQVSPYPGSTAPDTSSQPPP